MRIGPITAGALLAALLAGQAVAQPHEPNSLGAGWGQQQDEAREGVREHRLMPLGEVIARLRRMNPGPSSHSLDSGLERMGDKPVYRVRWMTNDGRVIDYIVDAVSGQVLSGG